MCLKGIDSGLCKHHLDEIVEGLNALPARLAEAKAELDGVLDGCARVMRQKEGLAVQFSEAEEGAKEVRAALEELIRAADPETNMSDIPLLDALSRARAALK